MIRHVLKALCGLAIFLAGCGTISGWINGNPPRTALRKVSVVVDVAANQGTASMLDLVFVYDAAAVAQLPKTGPDWFRQKAVLQLALATSIDVVALQVPAGSPTFSVKLPERAGKAIGVYALANYLAEDGQPIANLTPWREVTIRLMPTTIIYSGI